MPSLFAIDGVLLAKGNQLAYADDAPCCCPEDCGCGCVDFVCCNPSVTYTVTHDPDCSTGTDPPTVSAQWSWVGCAFAFNISGPYTAFEGNFTYPPASGCNAPVGVWSAGTIGNDREFNTPPDIAARRCIINAATLTIAKTAGGYSFTIAGVVVDPDWDCADACSQINGMWLVEC